MGFFRRSRVKQNRRADLRLGMRLELPEEPPARKVNMAAPDDAGTNHGGYPGEKRDLNEPHLPSFRFAPTPLSNARLSGGVPPSRQPQQLWEVFTPSRPQTADQLFVGRRTTIERIIKAIQEEHAHIVIYGGRGIGKTSVGNVIAESARRSGYHVSRCTCDSETTFERLFQEFLGNLPIDMVDRSVHGNSNATHGVDQLAHSGKLAPTDLSNTFEHFIEHVIFIIDEFDRVQDGNFRRKMSEAIKVISDSTDLLTIIIMGVGQTLQEFFGHHLSIQRHIRAIRLPLMKDDEIHALLRQGESRANIKFEKDVKNSIVALAKGTPYYAHLLGLLSGRHGLHRNSRIIDRDDLSGAISDVLMEIDPNLVAAYDAATEEEGNVFMTDLLFAAAAARFDDYGSFLISDVSEILGIYGTRTYQSLAVGRGLARLNKGNRGAILEKTITPGGTVRFQFINPLMRQYVLLRQFESRGDRTRAVLLSGTDSTQAEHRARNESEYFD